MNSVPSSVRLSLGLVCIVCAILLTADLMGFAPNPEKADLESRKRFIETLAVQLSLAAVNSDPVMIQSLMIALVGRNDDVISAALRRSDGVILAETNNHSASWNSIPKSHSTSTHAQVPIFKNERPFGNMEIRFKPMSRYQVAGMEVSDFTVFAISVAVVAMLLFWLFLQRSLSYLDPASVVPSRVKSALNVLAEGVLIMDEKENIVLANSAFSKMTGFSISELIGKKASALNWYQPHTGDEIQEKPWMKTTKIGKNSFGVPVSIKNTPEKQRIFVVNSTAIFDEKDCLKGALVSFEDVTQLEEKNMALQSAINELERARDEVARKNEKLHILATRDPLTGCLNRRSFKERFSLEYTLANSEGREIACIMMDIDHFKSVNDLYGHATGDEVIKMVADALNGSVRKGDLVGRYGGEEFCVFLPDMDIEKATQIAERCRIHIEQKVCSNVKVTSSFGVSSLALGSRTPEELINQADRALYFSKNRGRNQVTRYEKECESKDLKLANGCATRG